jgi:hypothetical protein
MENRIGMVKVYLQRVLQYAGLANFVMLLYLTQKETANFWWYAAGVGVLGVVFLWYDNKHVISAELDYLYERSNRFLALEKKVGEIHGKIIGQEVSRVEGAQ